MPPSEKIHEDLRFLINAHQAGKGLFKNVSFFLSLWGQLWVLTVVLRDLSTKIRKRKSQTVSFSLLRLRLGSILVVASIS